MVSSLLARCIIVTIGTLYPGYRSYKSLINSNLREVVNCLRYWIVFSIFIACETFTDVLLSWFPFYYWIKICLVLWIASPTGSTFLYKRFIQPLLREREQEIDRLIEETREKGYSAIIDLTNRGIRYASNVFLNTAVLGQSYLGEHLKRSLSTSDINRTVTVGRKPPGTVQEENEQESDSEFTDRLKEDRKYLDKETNNAKRVLSNTGENTLDDFEMPKVMARRNRTKNSNEPLPSDSTTGKRSTKKGKGKSVERPALSSNETDDEVENMRHKVDQRS